MPRDLTRTRKSYSFSRARPVYEPIIEEPNLLPTIALIHYQHVSGTTNFSITRKYPVNLDASASYVSTGKVAFTYPAVVSLTNADALATVVGPIALAISVEFSSSKINVYTKDDAGSSIDTDFTLIFY